MQGFLGNSSFCFPASSWPSPLIESQLEGGQLSSAGGEEATVTVVGERMAKLVFKELKDSLTHFALEWEGSFLLVKDSFLLFLLLPPDKVMLVAGLGGR